MCLLTAFLCDRVAFGRRYDKNPLLKYFTAEDFGLEAEQISSGKFLNGFIYKVDITSKWCLATSWKI